MSLLALVRSSPASPGANVGEHLGDLGSVGPLANHSSWREMPDCGERGFMGPASQALNLPISNSANSGRTGTSVDAPAGNICREIPKFLDLVFRIDCLPAKPDQIQPFVRSIADGAIVKVEAIDIDVRAQGVVHRSFRKKQKPQPGCPSAAFGPTAKLSGSDNPMVQSFIKLSTCSRV